MERIRTLLVDNNTAFLNAATQLLLSYPELDVIGSTRFGAEAIEKAQFLRPHLMVIDLMMPDMSGLEVTQTVKCWHDAPRVIIWTLYSDSRYRAASLEVGADGYISKLDISKQLLPLCRSLFSPQAI